MQRPQRILRAAATRPAFGRYDRARPRPMSTTRIASTFLLPVIAAFAQTACVLEDAPLGEPDAESVETTSDEAPADPDFDAEQNPDPGADPDGPGWQDLDFKSRPAICGDKKIELPETCDDGGNNAEDADCTPLCQVATCGDDFVHADEECDNGGDNDDAAEGYGSCSASCQLLEGCGDGFLQADYEECDHGFDGSPTCSPKCEWYSRIVFVTEAAFQGDLGGIAGADEKCQAEADDAGYGVPFRAWLSTAGGGVAWLDDDVDPRPLVRPDGEPIADSIDALATLEFPIEVTAKKTIAAFENVWSNTTPEGLSATNVDCGGWLETSGGGQIGLNSATDSTWTFKGSSTLCTKPAHLYCVEQPNDDN